MMSQARMKTQFNQGDERKQEHSEINKNFLMAVRKRDYPECSKWLTAGADINAKFGEYSQDTQDACSYCGPHDTPLTHAVKKDDEVLARFLLERKANTEVYNCWETPLINAAFNHNAKMVELLLEFGAKVNAVDTRTGSSALHYIFYGLREWTLEKYKSACHQIFSLLIKAGFVGSHNQILCMIKNRGFGESICKFFTDLWKIHTKDLENFYSQGAAAKALNEKLPDELSSKIGTFLTREEGAKLASTCKKAAKNAIDENNRQMQTIYESPLPLFQINKIKALVKKYKLSDTSQASLEKGLRNAATNNNIDDLKLFTRFVNNLDAQDANPKIRRTALHWASIKEHTECYQFLLQSGAKSNIPDANGETADKYLKSSVLSNSK